MASTYLTPLGGGDGTPAHHDLQEARSYIRCIGAPQERSRRRARSGGRGDRVDTPCSAFLRKTAGVPPRGFEPLISTLKGWRPRPLDDGGRTAGVYQRVRSRQPQAGARDSMNRMIAAARQPLPMIAARPPATAQPSALPLRPA